MKNTARTNIRIAATALASVAAFAASTAFAATQKTVIGETKNWEIVKVTEDGAFGQCAAHRKQRGPNKLVIVRRDIGWMVQFYNPAWAETAYRETSAQLTVQGRKIPLAGKFAVGTSFIFLLGKSDGVTDPVANAKWLMFLTERGKKISYTLRGIGQAMAQVANCYADAMSGSQRPVAAAPSTNGGAFGDPAPLPKVESNAGAFGEPAVTQPPAAEPKKAAAPSVEPSILDKEATLPFAREYLKHAKGYTFLSDDKGPKGWPAKWTLKSGVMGALVVLQNDPITTGKLLAERINLEKAACKGSFESQTDLKASVSTEGAETATGMYLCKGKSAKQVGSYMIRRISPSQTVVILEFIDVTTPAIASPKLVGA